MQGSILFLILILCVLPFDCFSQGKEGNNWFFGRRAGISFNTPDGSPQALLYTSPMVTHEGCSAISNANGDLPFYTDGSTVFNAIHDTMQNGTELGGHTSSSQSGVIVPFPGGENKYYVFTISVAYGSLYYSIVDMNLNGGLGAVINPKKNFLLTPTMERLTAVKHKNGIFYWIVTRTMWSDNYFSFLLDSDSLHASNPVVSSTGIVHNMTGVRCMKISPQGNKLVTGLIIQSSSGYENCIELCDFDVSTGLVSNPLLVDGFSSAYGFEFSPDEKLLYVTDMMRRYIRQMDITSGDTALIRASTNTIGDSSDYRNLALQIGPDGKIYVAQDGATYIDRINKPNIIGTGCDYEQEAVNISDGSPLTHCCILGLPNFIQSFFAPAAFSWENHCLGDTTFFSCDTASYDSVYWSFGDPGSGNNDSSSLFDPFHIYADTGYYPIQLISFYENFTDTLQDTIRINPLPQPQLPDLLSVCPGDTATLWPGHFESYLWYDARTDTAIKVDTAGLYSVMVTDSNQCSATDTTHFGIFPKPDPLVIFHD